MRLLPSLVAGLASCGTLGALLADHSLGYRLSRRLDRSIYRGPTDRHSVALTFDDGPGPDTPELLRYLAKEDLPGTFFFSGGQVELLPEIAMQVQAAGHEIGNHAFSHKPLAPQRARRPYLPSPGFIHQELARTQEILTGLCGKPPRFFRAPFGQRWIGLDVIRARMGLVGVQWTVIGHDWEWPADRVAQYVLEHVVPGAIICLHDGPHEGGDVDISELVRALNLIVPALRKQGYEFETVGDLLEPVAVNQPVVVAEA